MGIKNMVTKAVQKAGDTVSKYAALSPSQVEEIQIQRENYLLEEPKPDDVVAKELTERMLAASSIEIFNSFLPQLKDLYVPIEKEAEYGMDFRTDQNIRYINITKWVTDKKENNLEKLVNVYAVLSNEDCNIALVFNRTKTDTNVYLGVVNNKNSDNRVDGDIYMSRLIEAIRGNFPGAEWEDEQFGVIPCLDNDKAYSVATASNIPTEKSEKFASQTIEKLLDGVIPDSNEKEYTIILLATPIRDVEDRKNKLSEFHSGLTPYASWQTSFQLTESNSRAATATIGVNVGASAGVQNTQNYANTVTDSNTDSNAKTDTKSETHTETRGQTYTESETVTESSGNTKTSSKYKGSSDNVGANAGANIGPFNLGGNYGHGWNRGNATSYGETASKAIAKGISRATSESVSKATGRAVANTVGKAVTKSMAATKGIAKGTSLGVNVGANFAKSATVTAVIGKNEGITQTFENFNIKHALELLENQMKRFEESSALGMWDFAAYVLSEDHNIANNVAHSYLALTLGEDSYMSESAINVWRGNIEEERNRAKEISDYLRNLRHPIFGFNPDIIDMEGEGYADYLVYPPIVTATTSLSGKELAYSLNFPKKSIPGLPVLECAEFGRNVVSYDKNFADETINLGNIFHMNHAENTRVSLSKNSLASHVFVTGSTGSGKSNTIYKMLCEAREKGVKFLVVEPAKGEYKSIFGNDDDVNVYGTNPIITDLLRINPFSFPKGIHILEHLDRLIEIFNVCWPMYAAMPAVLKNAVEKSYKECGWNLITSENEYGEYIYPTFNDVARNIKSIIDSSEFDAENKGAYKGSLLTRLESLTNGVNGMIFTIDEISNEKLFDENTIVDLSRVGSSETKALIMGMLVLKLQEYRLVSSDEINKELQHITVLEEAHNILRRTSSDQSMESANLLGKSVEMIANAIAEMRTYGEGFVIADQAPGLMDMSVIRNTNTKIIMRLPDKSDRELVGRAANLNDDQIIELAKLPCGVGAIYQNEWVQPVLCKIDKHNTVNGKYMFNPEKSTYKYIDTEKLSESLLECIMSKEVLRKGNKSDLKRLKKQIITSKLDACIKCDFIDYLEEEEEKGISALRVLVYDFLAAKDAIDASANCNEISEWVNSVVNRLNPSIKHYSPKEIDLAMALILYEQAERDASYKDILGSFTELYLKEGGVY